MHACSSVLQRKVTYKHGEPRLPNINASALVQQFVVKHSESEEGSSKDEASDHVSPGCTWRVAGRGSSHIY